MNVVAFYSNTGQSKAVAEYVAKELNFPIVDIESDKDKRYENLVLVFPVHCQNIPNKVKDFLNGVSAEYLTLIATYGKICHGNVLYEIQKRYKHTIVGGAYIPTKHAYIQGDNEFVQYEDLSPLVEKIKNPSEVIFPKEYKNPLANMLPKLRSKIGVKITKNAQCTDCNVCTEICGVGGIKNGKTNSKCIRCLRCVDACPQGALTAKLNAPMKAYLVKSKRQNDIVMYL